MTSLEFKDYVMAFDLWAKKERKHLVLLINNAPSHKQVKQDNIHILFLPPKTISVLQPLDAEIIRSFKAKYRTQLNMFILDCKEENRAVKIDLRQAFTMIRHAWESVTEKCIKNCWKHTQILPIDSKNDSTSEAEDIQPLQDVDDVTSCVLSSTRCRQGGR